MKNENKSAKNCSGKQQNKTTGCSSKSTKNCK